MTGWEWLGTLAMAVFALVVLWRLNAGELVGTMTCAWFSNTGMTGHSPISVRREGSRDAWAVQVNLRMDVMGEYSWSYKPEEALAMADLLDEAARKAGPR